MRRTAQGVAGTAAAVALSGAIVLVIGTRESGAMPPYHDAWLARYPTSTLPNRLNLTIGSCRICHSPITYGTEATAYRLDIRDQLDLGFTIEQALANVEPLDSDGDGVSNIDEIMRPRTDLPGEIGYHPGLVGTQGVELLVAPIEPVTFEPESPTPACAGDTNVDGRCDFGDLNRLLTDFGVVFPGRPTDLNRDDRVDFVDLNILLSAFGGAC